MELYHLRSFIAVANEGQLTRAAKHLYISQPAVSAHIKTLEEELGVVLFSRTPQGMQLTREGQMLKAQAEKSLGTIDDLVQQAQELQQDITGVVKIGLNIEPDTLKSGEFTALMIAHYPKLEFHLLQRSSWEVVDALRSGVLDGGYVYGELAAEDVSILPLRTYKVMIVGPASWKERMALAGWRDIAAMPWIWMSPHCAFCQLAETAFAQHHVAPAKVVLADKEETLKTLVVSGVGLTLMVEEKARQGEAEGLLTCWAGALFEIDLAFAYLRHRAHDPRLHAILNVIGMVWGTAANNHTED